LLFAPSCVDSNRGLGLNSDKANPSQRATYLERTLLATLHHLPEPFSYSFLYIDAKHPNRRSSGLGSVANPTAGCSCYAEHLDSTSTAAATPPNRQQKPSSSRPDS